MGPVWRSAQPGAGGGSRDRGNTATFNLMLRLRVERRGSKSALRNDQGIQERIEEGFLEMTLLGLKDK